MKNKGFTLIELIFVILILSMLSLILVPTIQNLIKKNTDNMCLTLNESIKSAANDYMTSTRYENNYDCGITEYIVSLKDLIEKNYIKGPIIDPRTKEELDENLVVKFAYNCETNEFVSYFKYEKCKSDYVESNTDLLTGFKTVSPNGGCYNVVINANGGQLNYLDNLGNNKTGNADGILTISICSGGYASSYQSSGDLPTATKDGYVFGGWYYDNGTFSNQETCGTIYCIKKNIKISYNEDGKLLVEKSQKPLYAKWN